MPRKRESRPAITSAAMRPCRLAGPASAIEAPLAGDEVLDLDGVADGEDVRVARAHLLVDADAAAFADLEAGRLRQRGVRPHAEREDHDVGRIRSSRTWSGPRARRPSACLNPATPSLSARCTPCLLHVALDEARHFPVERRQHLVEHLDQGHVEPAMDEVLRHLEADEPAADHDRARRRASPIWKPEYLCIPARNSVPRSIHSRIVRASGTVLHLEDSRAGRCRAAADGSTAAPGDSTSLS